MRHAVTLAGGLNFIKPEQTVLIKPNVTGAAKFPTTTNPEVLYAVIKLVAERGPRRIYVSDRCFSPAFTEVAPKTIQVMKYVGHLDAVEAAKKDFKAPVVAVGLEAAAKELEYLGRPAKTPLWRRIKPANATHWPDGFEQAELLFAVDHVINVPVIKTHFQAWFTMSMKAFVGMSHHRSRLEFHRSLAGQWSLFRQKARRRRRRGIVPDTVAEDAAVAPFVNRIAELNLGIRPAMNILDGTRSFVFGGPSQGDTADPKLIVASTDRIAADATGVAVLKSIGTEPRLQNRPIWSNPFLRHGIKIGLGVGSPEQIVLKDAGIPDSRNRPHPHALVADRLSRGPLDRERGDMLEETFGRTASEAARAAGDVLQEWAHKFTVREKGPANLVTEADFAAQETIVKLIRSRFPDHAFLGEEGLDEPSAGQPYRWVIDPLDGTSNYVHRFPYYAVSIGLEYERQIVLGVIYDPNRDELFCAERGQGATLNGREIRPSHVTALAHAFVVASLPSAIAGDHPAVARLLRVLPHAQTLQRTGSAALNLAYVACGRIDAFWSSSLKPWDVAAGSLLVSEAGGLITRMNGEPFDFLLPDLLATNSPPLGRELQELLTPVND